MASEGVSERTSNWVGMEIYPSPEYAKIPLSRGVHRKKVEATGEVIPALKRAYDASANGQPAALDVRIARPSAS